MLRLLLTTHYSNSVNVFEQKWLPFVKNNVFKISIYF